VRRKTVDLTFDGEQDVDALDRFGRGRRLAEPHEIESAIVCSLRPIVTVHRCADPAETGQRENG
jgi:hypothetical protein